jgi:dsRNA-specific ribonuclease
MSNDLKQLEKSIDYQFQNTEHIHKALTHKSYATEQGLQEFNERMEFLGDSILSAVVADYLYHRYPDQDEGRLSQIKSQFVSTQNLSRWAKSINLGDFFYISKGEEINGGRKRESLLSILRSVAHHAVRHQKGIYLLKQLCFWLVLCRMIDQTSEYLYSRFLVLTFILSRN